MNIGFLVIFIVFSLYIYDNWYKNGNNEEKEEEYIEQQQQQQQKQQQQQQQYSTNERFDQNPDLIIQQKQKILHDEMQMVEEIQRKLQGYKKTDFQQEIEQIKRKYQFNIKYFQRQYNQIIKKYRDNIQQIKEKMEQNEQQHIQDKSKAKIQLQSIKSDVQTIRTIQENKIIEDLRVSEKEYEKKKDNLIKQMKEAISNQISVKSQIMNLVNELDKQTRQYESEIQQKINVWKQKKMKKQREQ